MCQNDAQLRFYVAIGVARCNDEALLQAEHADLVVPSLDEVVLDSLTHGRLLRRKTHDPLRAAA